MDSPGQIIGFIIIALVALFVIVAISRSIRIVPQAGALIIERLGRYQSTMYAGLHFLIPFIDRIRAGVDLRERVVPFQPQPVITSDNLVVSIDTVVYYQVTDPKAATYEIADYIQAIEQLTVTTIRNIIGSMDLEQTLTSRDQINGQLRGVLDEATGRWGIRVNRVELKAIDPPPSVQGAMEQQMRAERDRRAAILTAEGQAQAAILKAQGESRAILQVFDAIHRGDADPKLLAYQYLQMLPEIANGTSSKLWVIPTEFTAALGSITSAFGPGPTGGEPAGGTPAGGDTGPDSGTDGEGEARRGRRVAGAPEHLDALDVQLPETSLQDPAEALREARGQASEATAEASQAGETSGAPFDPTAAAGQRPADDEGVPPSANQ